MFISLLFLALSAYASDPLALISTDSERSAILEAQGKEIIRRSQLENLSCTELLADLPFTGSSKTPMHTALAALQLHMGSMHSFPKDCIDQLVQNMILSEVPAATRVAQELLNINESRQIRSETNYCAEPSSGIEHILSLSAKVEKIKSCAPLVQGKWKTVEGKSKSGISFNYSLIQEAPQKIRAVLNVDFTGDNDGVNGAIMLERSRACLNSIKGSLRGPNDEQMEISLLTPTQVEQIPNNLRPKKQTITIAPASARSHSAAYASSIDCPTILHEVLHLLGLCDEYPGEEDSYPCRAVGAPDSIMRDNWRAFGSALSENFRCECKTPDCIEVLNDPMKRDLILKPTFYDVLPWVFRNRYCKFDPGFFIKQIPEDKQIPAAYSAELSTQTSLKIVSVVNPGLESFDEASLLCECPAEDVICINQLQTFATPPAQLRPSSCPQPTEYKSSAVGLPPVSDQFNNGILQFTRPAQKNSLLEPYHFNKIIAGDCEEQITNYEQCAEYAYKSGTDACKNAPDRCLNSTSWGNQ